MSKMSEILIDIEEMLCEGLAPAEIARVLNVPVNWVYSTEQELLYPQGPGPGYDEPDQTC